MKDIIIIPTYNEKENIAYIVGRIAELYPDKEIWVVDDNSPDGTADIVRVLMEINPKIKLIVRKQKSGLGDAYKHVLKEAKTRDDIRHIVTMDADGSHDPVSVKDLLDALDEKDFSIGSRYVKGGKVSGWDKRRLALSYIGNLYSRFITGSPVKDGTAGFVAFKAKHLQDMDLDAISSAGYSYQIEFKGNMIKSGKTFREVPITFTERQLGKSKMSRQIITEGLKMPWSILSKDREALKNRLSLFAMGFVFVCASFFSTYKLSESPSVWYDEGIYIQSAVNVLEHGQMGFQLSPNEITHISRISVSYPLIYPLAFWFKVFGISVLSARSFMVLILISFLLAIFALSRRLFGNKIAFGAFILLTTFPPLYGNGKSVLGEVPALLYFALALWSMKPTSLVAHELRWSSKLIWLIIAGLFTGLCVVTKPIFLVLLPAIAVGMFIAWRRKEISIKHFGLYFVTALVPFIVWVFTQFQKGDTIASIFGAFSNPYRTENLISVMLHNIPHLFTNISPLYLVLIMLAWVAAIIIRNKKKILIPIEEIISLIFCCLILVAYLRLSGAYRYLFPAQAVSLIFFPSSLVILIGWMKWKIAFLRNWKILSSWTVIILLALYGCYGLMFNSWVADYYNSHKTQYWQEYFATASTTQSYFFYDTPEVAMFMTNNNYYQYIAPGGWSFRDNELNVLKEGKADYVIIRTDYLDEKTIELLNRYVPVKEAYKYTILGKKVAQLHPVLY